MFQDILQISKEAAQKAGKIIVDAMSKTHTIKNKRDFDFVTEVDVRSQDTIISHLKRFFPDHNFLAEEGVNEKSVDYRWIIDPLDGTTNFIHSFPYIAISMGLEYQGRIIYGLIYDPLREETFWAYEGKGAYLDNQRIEVSTIKNLSHALLATGFPFREKEKMGPYLKVFEELFHLTAGIRRAGAAALDLAYLACGRCDGFWEMGLSPWDIAGGYIIIKEAGGIVTDFEGGDRAIWEGHIIASNPHIYEKIFSIVSPILLPIVRS